MAGRSPGGKVFENRWHGFQDSALDGASVSDGPVRRAIQHVCPAAEPGSRGGRLPLQRQGAAHLPRYNVVEAMLVEVERLDPDRLPDLHTLAHALVRATDMAQSPFTQPPQGKVEEDV